MISNRAERRDASPPATHEIKALHVIHLVGEVVKAAVDYQVVAQKT